MTRFIVTGASGYIGGYVANFLIQQGHEVVAPVRNKTTFDPDKKVNALVNVIEGDLWEIKRSVWKEIAEGSTLIHLAWQDGFNHSAESHLDNLQKHFQFVEVLVELGISKFVGVGSMHEVGPVSGLVTESHEADPVNNYGKAKNALRMFTEALCFENNVEYLWLRCFYILGDDHKNNSVFSKMLRLESESASSISLTSGEASFDFIDVKRLAFLISVTSAEKSITGTLNLGSGNVMTLKERIELFKNENKLQLELKFGEFPERVGIGSGAWPDLGRLDFFLKGKCENHSEHEQ
jgi:dTDP-6-deoxy-L-talose 4-dehydrogenase (NAD+)